MKPRIPEGNPVNHEAIGAPSSRIPCAILGATGLVGQVFAARLATHPWFELAGLIASERRAGTSYGDAVSWRLPDPVPTRAAQMPLEALDPLRLAERGIRTIFSAIPKSLATSVESDLRRQGFRVFSNAGAHRRDPDVPILIPEANPQHLEWIERQGYPDGGFIVTNANCTATGLALALAPLVRYTIRSVTVATYQALSGAGAAGLERLETMESAIPHIPGEEEKVAWESRKILDRDVAIAATCVRVPVAFGHLESVWIELGDDPGEAAIREAWAGLSPPAAGLPSLTDPAILYDESDDAPRHDQAFDDESNGMTVRIGRLERDSSQPNRYRFVLLVNNVVRGAAGGSIANAEWFRAKYRVDD